MTRTFFWGEPDEETARIYDIARRANETARGAHRAGRAHVRWTVPRAV